MSNGTGHLFGGDWTQEKLRMLRNYLREYTKIMAKQPFTFGYIDAFAGAGYIRAEEAIENETSLFPGFDDEESKKFLQGSVQTALEVEPPFQKYVFIEKDAKSFQELTKIKQKYPRKEIDLVNTDANEWLLDSCDKDWTSHRAVVFLDPYGMQVKWETMEAIAKTKAIDVWILFPLGIGANRLLKRRGNLPPEWEEKLNELLGTVEWKKRFYESNPTLFGGESRNKTIDLQGIGNFYNERLKEIFEQVADNPRPLYNSRNNPMYLFCFAAANPKGGPTAVRIARHILKNA